MLRLVLCNCSPDESDELAAGMVEAGLAACVNILTGVRSHYVWDGEVCEDPEHTLLIKTTEASFGELESWIQKHHSYDVPEIVALDPSEVADDYREWAEEWVDGSA